MGVTMRGGVMNSLVFITKVIMALLCLIIVSITITILSPILIPYIIIDWVIRMSRQARIEEQLWNQ